MSAHRETRKEQAVQVRADSVHYQDSDRSKLLHPPLYFRGTRLRFTPLPRLVPQKYCSGRPLHSFNQLKGFEKIWNDRIRIQTVHGFTVVITIRDAENRATRRSRSKCIVERIADQ